MRRKKKARGLLTTSLNLNNQWARLESNQHALAGTRPSTLRVCQFRHEPNQTKVTGRFTAENAEVAEKKQKSALEYEFLSQ